MHHKHKQKIREWTASNVCWVELAKRLQIIAESLGLPTLDKDKMAIIFDFIRKEFPDFSMDEIATAFDKYNAEKLHKEINHYGQFSNKFIGAVLNAYRELRRSVIDKNKRALIEESTPKSKEQVEKEAFEFITKYKTENKKLPLYGPWIKAYNHAHRQGLIEITEAIRTQYREIVQAQIDKKVEDLRGDVMKIRDVKLAGEKNMVLTMKELYIKDWIEFNY